ncbi:methionine ABC transporter ATP-binding protein [Treponema peruense]|uniref:Cell division ATP-binding protein FtsE n=1 Tax=Treponema peruense TaxID=2787628 RepID=A0A7T3RDU5_9SPIR|nr:ATP-binding cassette domain-containing protein [Treponema peruense]QQA01245.1 ATP-binding cassette domain-containing protein [Treponema peruense]
MIELKDINKVFKDKNQNEFYAAKDVNLKINDGEIFGIIGFSGAGKSTVVRCINLLGRPTSGQVIVNEKNLLELSAKELREERKKIGMIFQHFNLMPSRTVFENIAFPLKHSGLSKKQVQEKVRELLTLVELTDKESQYPSQLSGGQKQRVAIARALANNPKILLCDEATSALDPTTTKQILGLLKKLRDKLNLTIVIITHQINVVKDICDKVAVMEHGKVVETSDVFDIFANPKDEVTKRFIHSTTNLQKIEELISENSNVVQLKKGEKIIRLSYLQKNVSEPLISTVSSKFGVVLNIIFADIEIVQGAPVGGTVAIFSGENQNIQNALGWLKEKNVGIEILKQE